MKLAWYVNRLRSMGPAEVLHRLVEQARKMRSRRHGQGWRHYSAPPVRPVFAGLRQRVLAATPAQRVAIAAAAADLRAGRFSALGRDWPQRGPADLFPASLWRLDPVHGGDWPGPERYTFDIAYRHDGSRGDIKYVWEINRLQMLPVFAADAVLGGSGVALAAIEAAIGSWYDANPPFTGVGWASCIEVALRAISLIVVLDLVGAQLDAAVRDKAVQILAASAYWLPRFASRHSSANNHRVAELAGEYLIGLALGRPIDAARKALAVEAGRQILADGAGAEQSPTYAAFTAELLLMAALAGRLNGAPLPDPVDTRLAAFTDFITSLGPCARFGDDDEGRVLTLGEEHDYPASVAAAIGGFLGIPAPAPAQADFRALIFGSPPPALVAGEGLRTFAEGGISHWRGDLAGRRVDLGFDHGPLGYLAIAAHGHADALSLTLAIDGTPILVDPGTFLYGSGGVWRNWFRSTPAHNTLNIDGESQSIMSGPFNWSHKANVTLVEAVPGADWRLVARHDGYRGRFGVVHDRTLQRQGDAIVLTDRLLGATRRAEIVLQLAVGLDVELAQNVATVSRQGEALLSIAFPDSAVTCAAGGDRPGQGGWVSPRFGIRQPAMRLAWQGAVGEAGVHCRIVPIGPERD